MPRFSKIQISRTKYLVVALLIAVLHLLQIKTVYAADMLNESVTISSSVAGEIVNHDYQFRIPTTGNVGSIEFTYCTNSPFSIATCSPPAGVDVTAAVLDSESGATGFVVDPLTTSNNLIISRAVSSISSGTLLNYNFSNITNPTTDDETVYVRINSYPTVDATGPATDEGAVVFKTTGQLTTSGFVPPYITFCTAVQVSDRCTTTTGSRLDLGEFNEFSTATGTTQFGVATNYPLGYIVFVSGGTLTSGNNTIPALAAPTGPQIGVSQFGMNVVSNTNPSVGSAIGGIGTGLPGSNYGSVNSFYYVPGSIIGRSVLPTEFNTYTVSHMVNVSPAQPAGVYNTTLQYIATAQF